MGPVRHTLLYIVVIELLFVVKMDAQKFYLNEYGTEQGLSVPSVNDAYQDSLGQMWIATDGGLYLYDGLDFHLIERGIRSRYIRDIVGTNDQSVVFSHDAGLTFAQPSFGSLEIIEDNRSQNNDIIKYPNRLFVDHKGRTWISLPSGKLIRLDGEETEVILDEVPVKDNADLHYSFAIMNETDFFVASPGGKLFLFQGTQNQMIFLGEYFEIEDLLFNDGRLLIAGEELLVLSLTDDISNLRRIWSSGDSESKFTSLAADSEGRIFVGTSGRGLFELLQNSDSFAFREVYSNNDPHRIDRLPFDRINSIYISDDNSIWVCAEEGLGLLQRRFFEGAQNLPNDNATSLALADNGDVYVAMGDVYRIRQTDLDYSASKLDVASVGAYNGLAVRGDDLWSGTNNGEVIKMDLNGKLKKIFPFSDRGAGIFRICADTKNRKWFCQAPRDKPILGLAMIDQDDKVHLYEEEKGFENRMLVVKEGPRNEIYAAGIGRNSYLYKYVPEDDQFVNMSISLTFPVSPNFEVHDIAIDDRGLVWLASTDGLLRHDMENVIRPDLGDLYTGKEVRAVAVLPDQSIWISTDIYGVLRYRDGETLSLGEEAGLPTKIMAYRSIMPDHNQKLWVNTLEGVAHTSQSLPQPLPTPVPILHALTYNNRELDASVTEHDLVTGGQLVLDFIALTYPGENTKYQYALDQGGLSGWWPIGNIHEAKISIDNQNIQGIYIKAQKAGGYSWSYPLHIALDVNPVWYKRKVSLALFSLLAIGLIAYFWRKNINRFKERIFHLESQLDKGDDIGVDKIFTSTAAESSQKELNSSDELLATSLDLVYEVTELTDAGMKWDHILEHLSLALMKLPHTSAFEVGILNKTSNVFEIEGYSHLKNAFYSRDEEWSKPNSLLKKAIKTQTLNAVYNVELNGDYLHPWTGEFEMVITIPIVLDAGRDAVICIYGNKELDNEHFLKAARSIANYLELIH